MHSSGFGNHLLEARDISHALELAGVPGGVGCLEGHQPQAPGIPDAALNPSPALRDP